jgi:hypothetical protein
MFCSPGLSDSVPRIHSTTTSLPNFRQMTFGRITRIIHDEASVPRIAYRGRIRNTRDPLWRRLDVQESQLGSDRNIRPQLDDREYLIDRVRPMFAARFGRQLHVRVVHDENTMLLYAYSKQIALILHDGECRSVRRNCPV